MSNRTYDILKWIFTTGLPAITTLYITLEMILCWQYTAQIAATMTAIITCGCALLNISSVKYQK